MNTGTTHPEDQTEATAAKQPWLPEIAVFIAAVIGRLPAMGAWWNLDDWGQLARAAGVATSTEEAVGTARWLSQHLYWDLTWPLFGLNSDPHAIIRLLLHGLAAVLVVRIARHGGLGSLSRLVAGLVFAASPLAFTPLYWASGIQELLAAVFALAAVNLWLAGATGGRRMLAGAVTLATLSIFSKESGLGLPVLFLIFAWLKLGVRLEDKLYAWAMIMILLAVAVSESVLVLNMFAGGAGEAYALGGITTGLINLGAFGWWLMSPGPILASGMNLYMMSAGALMFVAWTAWGVVRYRRRQPMVLLCLVSALLILAPVLLLETQVAPYLAYLAVAPLALLVGSITAQFKFGNLDHRSKLPLVGFLALAATAWGFFGMETRLSNRNELGLVADPVARATALSWHACRTMKSLQEQPGLSGPGSTGFTHLTLLQPLVGDTTFDLAESMGERWTQPSDMYEALGGVLGPQLVLPAKTQVNWANGLTTASSKAIVLCETGTGFKMWGQAANAVLYAALTDVGLGHFQRARGHLLRAAELGGKQIMFVYDEGQMVIPLPFVVKNREAFTDWTIALLDQGVPLVEVSGLQEMFFNLLSSSTGRSLDELTKGSQLLMPPAAPAEQTKKEDHGKSE